MENSNLSQPAQSSDDHRILLLQRFKLLQNKTAAIADIGCGNGFICNRLTAMGFNHVYGFDVITPQLNQYTWQFAQIDFNATDWYKDLLQTTQTNLGLVIAFDIIEHLHSPVRFLENIQHILANDGHLVLSTPNINSLERYLNPKHWSGAADPQHKVLFNSYSLKFLLERCNFHVEHLSAPIRKLGAINRIFPWLGGQLFCISNMD